MKDSGLVIKATEDMAVVEVACLTEACHNCSARSICTGSSSSSGLLTAKNPLKAVPGDRVALEIPDSKYNRALIFIFSTLLLACLLGLGLGSLISLWLSLPAQRSSLIGLLVALLLAPFGLHRYFQKRNKSLFYPIITAIINKGENNGPAPLS